MAAAICDVSAQSSVDTIRYGVDLVGVEQVALGSDYDGSTQVPFDTARLAMLTQTMLDEGFSEREIRLVMGGNMRRFLAEQLPSTDPPSPWPVTCGQLSRALLPWLQRPITPRIQRTAGTAAAANGVSPMPLESRRGMDLAGHLARFTPHHSED